MPYLRLQIGGGELQNKSAPSQQYTFGIKEPKTGGFIGGEFGFGSGYADTSYYTIGYGLYNFGYLVVPVNVFGGYQWYFYDRPHYMLGVRVRGHFGYTNYNANLSRYWARNSGNASLTSHAIQYGAEAQLIWDFLDYESHTLGMHFAPLGFEGSTFFGKVKANGQTQDLGSHTKFAYTIGIGLHYYYSGNHQVYLTHRYRTYSHLYNTGEYYSVANNVFSFGYAYKF